MASFELSLPAAGLVRLLVVDVTGRLVRQLHDGVVSAGEQRLTWDGRDSQGRPVDGGVYLVRVSTVDGIVTGRIVIAR